MLLWPAAFTCDGAESTSSRGQGFAWCCQGPGCVLVWVCGWETMGEAASLCGHGAQTQAPVG